MPEFAMTTAALPSMTSPVLRKLRDYWLGLRGERAMPARADIDPLHIPALLPQVVLVDVIGAPPVFRYRLIGTDVVEMANRDATGRALDESLYGANTERMLLAYRETVADCSPKAVREIVHFVAKDWVTIEVLLLPLSNDGHTVTMILGGVDIVDEKPATRNRDQRDVLDWTL